MASIVRGFLLLCLLSLSENMQVYGVPISPKLEKKLGPYFFRPGQPSAKCIRLPEPDRNSPATRCMSRRFRPLCSLSFWTNNLWSQTTKEHFFPRWWFVCLRLPRYSWNGIRFRSRCDRSSFDGKVIRSRKGSGIRKWCKCIAAEWMTLVRQWWSQLEAHKSTEISRY